MTHSDPNNIHTYPANWTTRDSDNLDRSAKAEATIAALTGIMLVLLVAGLILAIVGYIKAAERLDNIENYTEQTATDVAP